MSTSDDDARRRVREDLGPALVVTGAPGTGRTQLLVDRAGALVRTGRVAPNEVAVVASSEAAAADLRARLRAQLRIAAPSSGPTQAESSEPVVGTTIDFARHILDEHGLRVGLAPGFTMLDRAAERADFDDRWERFTDSLFDDDTARPALAAAFALGLTPEALRAVAIELHDRRDRLDASALGGGEAWWQAPSAAPRVTIGPVLTALDAAVSLGAWCHDPDDLLRQHLDRLTTIRAELVALEVDDHAVVAFLDTRRPFTCALGQQARWSDRVEEVRAACTEAESARRTLLSSAADRALTDLRARLAHFVRSVADERQQGGRLAPRDVLVLARSLLRADRPPRASLGLAYRCLLVDALDDDLEAELFALVFDAVGGDANHGIAHPGSVWVRGAASRTPKEPLEEVLLTVNQRAVPGVVRFVHAVAAPVEGAAAGIPGPAAARQPMALLWRPPSRAGTGTNKTPPSDPARIRGGAAQLALGELEQAHSAGAATAGPDGAAPVSVATGRGVAPVVVVGGPMPASASDVRRALARGVADAVVEVATSGWAVVDEDRMARRARWRDVAVLLPPGSAFGLFDAVEEALDTAGVPLHTADAALAWACEDVRDVLAVLAAADDPTDDLAVLTALRTPALGCGDDDLVTWHRGGGTLDATAPPPAGFNAHPVAHAIGLVGRLHEARWWSEPSALVSMALTELEIFALCLAHPLPADHMQRMRFLAGRARLFDDTTGGSLRAFLRWAALHADGVGEAASLGPPDADADAVRIMTTRAAEGLDFPIVVVAGIEAAGEAWAPAVVWEEKGAPEIRAGRGLRTAGYDDALARRRQRDDVELSRLLTAMSRARDHLVVCAHHREREAPVGVASTFTQACARNPSLWRRLPVDAGATGANAEDAAARPEGAEAGDVWSTLGDMASDAELATWEAKMEAFAIRRRVALQRSRAHQKR